MSPSIARASRAHAVADAGASSHVSPVLASPVLPFVDDVRAAVERRLDAWIARAERAAAEAGGEPEALVRALAELVRRGGKRLRPVLLAAAARACGAPALSPAVVEAGAALELMQAYLLVHDDWMDDDATRRGGPTLHVVFAARHRDAHLGASMAVLAGDLASALSQRAIAELDVEPRVALAVSQVFARVHQEVVLGQVLDLTLGAHDAAAVERMHTLKTGSYTTRGPLEMGALLAGASDQALLALERFAAPLGVAFQLRDDLLGVFGDPAQTGKPSGSDLRARKRTALVAEALTRLDQTERARLDALLARDTPSDAEVEWAREAIERCGARDAIEARAAALLAEARAALESGPFDPEGRELLSSLAGALVERRA